MAERGYYVSKRGTTWLKREREILILDMFKIRWLSPTTYYSMPRTWYSVVQRGYNVAKTRQNVKITRPTDCYVLLRLLTRCAAVCYVVASLHPRSPCQIMPRCVTATIPCNTLYYVMSCLCYVVPRCTTLYYVVRLCATLWYVMIRCGTL